MYQKAIRREAKQQGIPRLPELLILAFTWLRIGTYGALPTDKDGGYSLILKHDLAREQEKLMLKTWYEPVHNHREVETGALAFDVKDCIRRASRILARDSAYSNGTEFNDARSGWERSLASVFVAKSAKFKLINILDNTLKTHKPDGSVALRPIHVASSHPCKKIMTFCAAELRSHLNSISYLPKDTDAVLQFFSRTLISANCWFLPFDIKDYYLNGSACELVHDSKGVIRQSRR